MSYEINVSLKGSHFFATHERSIDSSEKAKKMVRLFMAKFPKEEGYAISCTFHPGVSFQVFDSEGKYGSSDVENIRFISVGERGQE